MDNDDILEELKRVGGRGMSSETNWLEIKKEYLRRTVDGEKVKLAELAKEFGVKASTLRSRKNREKWDEFLENVATQFEDCCNAAATDNNEEDAGEGNPQNNGEKKSRNKTVQTKANIKRSISQLGNKNAVGNSNAPPKGNQRARKHGFYAKYLPTDVYDIFNDIEEMSQLDILWNSIKLKFATIIKAQEIMHVESKDEMIKEIKKRKIIKGMSYTKEEEWEFQFAWDRYATFLNTQSRAFSELRGLIKQYNELVDRDGATEEQRLRIQKLQLEIDRMTGDNAGDETEEWVKAIEEIAAKRRGNNEQ